jgi:hypothetical protein
VVTVSLEIPSDAEVGGYLVYITGTSADSVESVDLSVSMEVEEKEQGLELSFFLLLIVLVVIIAIVAVVMATRRKGKKADVPKGGYPVREAPRVTAVSTQTPYQEHLPAKMPYDGPIFPSFETIKCPVCYAAFEVEVGRRPLRVECPNCGASGTIN